MRGAEMSSIEPATIRCSNVKVVVFDIPPCRNSEASQEVHFSCSSSADSNLCKCALGGSSGRISSAVRCRPKGHSQRQKCQHDNTFHEPPSRDALSYTHLT